MDREAVHNSSLCKGHQIYASRIVNRAHYGGSSQRDGQGSGAGEADGSDTEVLPDLRGHRSVGIHCGVQTHQAGQGIKFRLDPAMLAQLQNTAGFTPVIINMQPLKSLQDFLGLNEEPAI